MSVKTRKSKRTTIIVVIIVVVIVAVVVCAGVYVGYRLLTGQGLQGTLLPVRASLEAFTTLSIGIMGAWFFLYRLNDQ